MNTRQYLDMRYEAYKNDSIDWKDPNESAPDLKLWDTTRYADWQKVLIGETARFDNVTASVTGGNTSTQYLIRGTFQHETTVMPGDFKDRRGSLYFDLNNKFLQQKLNFNLSGSYFLDNNRLPGSDPTQFAVATSPNAPSSHNNDGTINWEPNSFGGATWQNPFATLSEIYQIKTTNLIANGVIQYKILPGLELKGNIGYNNISSKDFQSTPQDAIRPEYRSFLQRSAFYGDKTLTSWIIEPQLNWEKSTKHGKFDLLFGISVQHSNNNGGILKGTGYNSDIGLEDMRSASFVSVNTTFATTYKYAASFTRLNYNLLGRYVLNLTARRDGSSRFGAKTPT